MATKPIVTVSDVIIVSSLFGCPSHPFWSSRPFCKTLNSTLAVLDPVCLRKAMSFLSCVWQYLPAPELAFSSVGHRPSSAVHKQMRRKRALQFKELLTNSLHQRVQEFDAEREVQVPSSGVASRWWVCDFALNHKTELALGTTLYSSPKTVISHPWQITHQSHHSRVGRLW